MTTSVRGTLLRVSFQSVVNTCSGGIGVVTCSMGKEGLVGPGGETLRIKLSHVGFANWENIHATGAIDLPLITCPSQEDHLSTSLILDECIPCSLTPLARCKLGMDV